MWDGVYVHTRVDQQIAGVIDSTGAFAGSLGPVPEGYCWYVERLTCQSNTAVASGPTTTLEIFVSTDITGPTSPDKTGRQDMTLLPANDVSDQNSPIYVGPGMFLVAQWAGLTTGNRVRLTTQIRVHELMRTLGAKMIPTDDVIVDQPPDENKPGEDLLMTTLHELADVTVV